MVDQPKKTNKKTKFEMNPEVSDRDTKAGEIKMESRVISGGYRDDDGKYHPPKTADGVYKDKLKKKAEIMKKTSAAMRKEAVDPQQVAHDRDVAGRKGGYFVTNHEGEKTHSTPFKSSGEAIEHADAQEIKTGRTHTVHHIMNGKIQKQWQSNDSGKWHSYSDHAGDKSPIKESVEELDETLSVVARLKKAREMTKLSNSGSLERGKLKKSFAAMTMNRAVKLGWKGARNQMKKNMAKGASYSSLSAATKSRIEKLVSKRVAQRKVLARQLTKGIMAKESMDINESFEMMLEGKRYYRQLMTKNGKVNMRFKHFRSKSSLKESSDAEALNVIAQLHEVVTKLKK